MAKNFVEKNLGVIILGVLAVMFLAPGTFSNLFAAVGGSTSGNEIAPVTVCESSTTPSVTFNAHDKHTGATLTGTVKYKVNDDGIESVALGTAIAASPDDVIEYIAGANAYHNVSSKFTVPCKEVVKESLEMVGHDTTFNISFLKNDDDNDNTAAAPQAIAAGETVDLALRLKSSANLGGDYYIVLQYNDSAMKNVQLIGEGVESIGVPSHFTVEAVEYTAVGYAIGSFEDITKKDYTLRVEAQSGTNPGVTDKVIGNLYSYSWYIDEDDGRTFKYGAEDENRVRLGDQTDLEFQARFS